MSKNTIADGYKASNPFCPLLLPLLCPFRCQHSVDGLTAVFLYLLFLPMSQTGVQLWIRSSCLHLPNVRIIGVCHHI